MPTLDVGDRRTIAGHVYDYLNAVDPNSAMKMFTSTHESARKANLSPDMYDPKDQLREWLPIVAREAKGGDERAIQALQDISDYLDSPKLKSREFRQRAGELAVTPVSAPVGEPVKPEFREAQRSQAMNIAAGAKESLEAQGGGSPLQRQAVKNIYQAQQLTPIEKPLLPSEVAKLAAAQSFGQLESFRQIPGGVGAAIARPVAGMLGYNMPTGEPLQTQMDIQSMGAGPAVLAAGLRGLAGQTEQEYGPRASSGQAFGAGVTAGAAGMAPWLATGPVGGMVGGALEGTKLATTGAALAKMFSVGEAAHPARQFITSAAKTGTAFRALNLLTRYGLYGQQALQESIRSPEEWAMDYAIPAGGKLAHIGAVKLGTKINKLRTERMAKVKGAKGVPTQPAFAEGAPTIPEVPKPAPAEVKGPTRPGKLAPEQVIVYARDGTLPEGYQDVRTFYSDLSKDPQTRATIMRSAASPQADLGTKMLAQGVLDYEANLGDINRNVERLIKTGTMPDLRKVELSPAHIDILTEAANGAMDDPLARNARQILNFIRNAKLEKEKAAETGKGGKPAEAAFDLEKYMSSRTEELRKERDADPQAFHANALKRFMGYNRKPTINGKQVKYQAFGSPDFGNTQAEVEAYLRTHVGTQIKASQIPIKAADYLAHKAVRNEGQAPPEAAAPTTPAPSGGPKKGGPTLNVPPTPAEPPPATKETLAADLAAIKGKGGGGGSQVPPAPTAPPAPTTPTEAAPPAPAPAAAPKVEERRQPANATYRMLVDSLINDVGKTEGKPTMEGVNKLLAMAEDENRPADIRRAASAAASHVLYDYAHREYGGAVIAGSTADEAQRLPIKDAQARIERAEQVIKEKEAPAKPAEAAPPAEEKRVFTDEELEARRLRMEEARKKGKGTKLPGGLTGPKWFDEPETISYYSYLAGHVAETLIRKGVKITRDTWKEVMRTLDTALGESGEQLSSIHLDWLWAHPQVQAAIDAVRKPAAAQTGEGAPETRPAVPEIDKVAMAHAGVTFGPAPGRLADAATLKAHGETSRQAIMQMYDQSLPEVRKALLQHPHSEYARATWEKLIKGTHPDLSNDELNYLWRTTDTLEALHDARRTFGSRPRRRQIISSGVAKYLASEKVSDTDFTENLYAPEMTEDTLFEALKNIEHKIYDLRDIPEGELVTGPRRRVYQVHEVTAPDGEVYRSYIELPPGATEGASAIPKGVTYHPGKITPSYEARVEPEVHGQRVTRFVTRDIPSPDEVLDASSRQPYNPNRVVVEPAPSDVPIERAKRTEPIKVKGRGYEKTIGARLPSAEARQRELFPGLRPSMVYPAEEEPTPPRPERLFGMRLFPSEPITEPKGYKTEEQLSKHVEIQRRLLNVAFGGGPHRPEIMVSDILPAINRLREMKLATTEERAVRVELINRLMEDHQRHLNYVEADFQRKGEQGVEQVPAANAAIALPSWRYKRGASEPPGAWRGVTSEYMAALGEYQRLVREAAAHTGERTRERKQLLLRVANAAEELKAMRAEAARQTDTVLRRMEYRRDAIRERMAADRLANPATETYFLDMPVIGGGSDTSPEMLVPALPGGKLSYLDAEGKHQTVEIPRDIDVTTTYTGGLFRIPTEKGVLEIPADNVIGVEQTRNYIPIGKSQITELLRMVYERAASSRGDLTPEQAAQRREEGGARLYAYLWTMRERPEALAALYAYIDPELFRTQAVAGETTMAIARAAKAEDPMSGFREGIIQRRYRKATRDWRDNWTFRDRIAQILEDRKREQNFDLRIERAPDDATRAKLITARDAFLKNITPPEFTQGLRTIPQHEITRVMEPRTEAGKMRRAHSEGILAGPPEGPMQALIRDPHKLESDIIDILLELRDSMAFPTDYRTGKRMSGEPYLEWTGRGLRAIQHAVNHLGTLQIADVKKLPEAFGNALQQFSQPGASKEMRDFLEYYRQKGGKSVSRFKGGSTKEAKALATLSDVLAAVVTWKNAKEVGGIDRWIKLMKDNGHLSWSMPDFKYERGELIGPEVTSEGTAARPALTDEGVDLEGGLRSTEPFVDWEDFAPYKGTKAPTATRNELTRLIEAALERPELWSKDAKGQITDERLVKPLALVANNTQFEHGHMVEAHPLASKLRKALQTAGVDTKTLRARYEEEGTPLIAETLTKHVTPSVEEAARLIMNQDIAAGDVQLPSAVPPPADMFANLRGQPKSEVWKQVKPLFYQVRAAADARGETPPTASQFLKQILAEPAKVAEEAKKSGIEFPRLEPRKYVRREKLRGRGRTHIAEYTIDSPMGRFIHNLFLESDRPKQASERRGTLRDLAFSMYDTFIKTREAVEAVSQKQTKGARAGRTLNIPGGISAEEAPTPATAERLTWEEIVMRRKYRELADKILKAQRFKVKIPQRMLAWAKRTELEGPDQYVVEERAKISSTAPPPPEKGYIVPHQVVDYAFVGKGVAWKVDYTVPGMPEGETKSMTGTPDEVYAFVKQVKEAADAQGVPVTDYIKFMLIDPRSTRTKDPAARARRDITNLTEVTMRQIERRRDRIKEDMAREKSGGFFYDEEQ